VLSWIRADGFGSGEGCLIKCGAQRMEMESVTSGGFATGILRTTALYFFGYAKARFRVPPTLRSSLELVIGSIRFGKI
jgi:hypothetical protein